MTYVREVTKLTIINLDYIDYFICTMHWPSWRGGCGGGLGSYGTRVRISGSACFFFVFFLVINTTVLICKFNITVSTQFSYFITPYMMPRPPAPSAL